VQSGNHFRRLPTTEAMLDKVDPDKALAVYKSRFTDFGNFTFVFVGNIDLKVLQPLVETYLGSLPSAGKKPHWKDIGIKYPAGSVTKTIVAGTEPKSFVSMTMGAPDKWTLDGERDAQILSMVLAIRFREVLREDMGGVYSVSANADLSRQPVQRRTFHVFFGCDPANVEKLKQAVFDEMTKIAKTGIGDEYLVKVKEQLRREHEVNLKENSWWLSQLHEAYWFGDDFTTRTDVGAISARVTSDNVKAAAAHFFDPKHFVFGVMKPKPTAAPPPAK
jgi:zinc protease